ncbi:MAG TPA: LacI family DNA-binding transcriptional regulator [Pontimonas sp.]|nr:LacI family DNA-binding transcriptional regulator [Pontimonas sp.]
MSASIKDVAVHAGVSVGTVSNVLNHPSRVSSATVTRVQTSISELGFVRNDAARQLRAGESRTIALLVFDAANPFFTALARGAEDAATEEGYSVILANTSESQEREHSYLDLFEEQRVRGILVSPYGDVEERLSTLKKFGIPSVLVDRVSEKQLFSSVSVDDHAGGAIAANHLLSLGRTKLGFVGGPLEIPQVADRLQGAKDALRLTPAATLAVFETSATTVLEGRRAGEEINALPKDERPTALFAANDLVAIGLLQALVATGSLRVPEDIAIVGYDDIDFATSAIVPLTSIRQPSALMGETALKLLSEEALDPTRKPRRVVFQPELVIRDSA